MLLKFAAFIDLTEQAGAQQLTHIHHPEDRPLLHGAEGFSHAHGALTQAHEHMKANKKSSDLTMKYDGSPSLVFGHHPESKKFFVATKSAFNKNPKINYSDEDIEKNHGHAPGLVKKLKAALHHLPKVAPKSGVYQGDVMHTPEDHKEGKGGSVSFTPNTITYTASGPEAEKVKKSKIGIVVHEQYHQNSRKPGIENMTVSPKPDTENFRSHQDVHFKTAEHDTSKVEYPHKDQAAFESHLKAAKAIHDRHGAKMYKATERHQGDGGHLATYINQTVRTDAKPTVAGFQEHLKSTFEKQASKLKTPANAEKKRNEGFEHIDHVRANQEHYTNVLNMHHHLAQAKNVLVKNLEKHEGGLQHHIGDVQSKPEGFVVNHKFKGKTEPTKLVNRAEFAKANLLKVRG